MVKTFDNEVKSTKRYVYCDIELDDTCVTIVWEDYNKFEVITVSKTDEKIRGNLFLSEEGYPANIKELALYKDFY